MAPSDYVPSEWVRVLLVVDGVVPKDIRQNTLWQNRVTGRCWFTSDLARTGPYSTSGVANPDWYGGGLPGSVSHPRTRAVALTAISRLLYKIT